MIHANGSKDFGWKVVYYPLYGSYKSTGVMDGGMMVNEWVEFDEPRALVEKQTKVNGIITKYDFREVPLRYLEINPPTSN